MHVPTPVRMGCACSGETKGTEERYETGKSDGRSSHSSNYAVSCLACVGQTNQPNEDQGSNGAELVGYQNIK